MTGAKAYIVTREGVYRHEILGVYLSFKEADKRAELCSADDGYHEYQVTEVTLDKDKEDDDTDIGLSAWRARSCVRRKSGDMTNA